MCFCCCHFQIKKKKINTCDASIFYKLFSFAYQSPRHEEDNPVEAAARSLNLNSNSSLEEFAVKKRKFTNIC